MTKLPFLDREDTIQNQKQTQLQAPHQFYAFHLGRFSTNVNYWERLELTAWICEHIHSQMMPMVLPSKIVATVSPEILDNNTSKRFFIDSKGGVVSHNTWQGGYGLYQTVL